MFHLAKFDYWMENTNQHEKAEPSPNGFQYMDGTSFLDPVIEPIFQLLWIIYPLVMSK